MNVVLPLHEQEMQMPLDWGDSAKQVKTSQEDTVFSLVLLLPRQQKKTVSLWSTVP